MTYRDGEIIGLDHDGCIVQWASDKGAPYNCGQTPEQFGVDNITPTEAQRLYDALPVAATPLEFLNSIGNWGLTEAEAKLAIKLAEIIESSL